MSTQAPTTDLAAALERGAKGLYSAEAAIQLVIDTGLVNRLDHAADWSDDRTMAFIDWDTALDAPWSGGERRVLTIAADLHTNRLDVSSLSTPWLDAVLAAIRHANGDD